MSAIDDLARAATPSERIRALSAWIDGTPTNQARDPEAVMWSRVTKVCEESGEVWRALAAAVGENPRKGVHGSLADVVDELLDTASAALAAVAHIYDATRQRSNVDLYDLLDVHVAATVGRAIASERARE